MTTSSPNIIYCEKLSPLPAKKAAQAITIWWVRVKAAHEEYEPIG